MASSPRPQHAPAYRRLCDILRKAREDSGLTVRELGRRLRKDGSAITRCETGSRRIDPVEFAQWCLACGVDPAEAMGELVRRGRIR